MLTELPQVVGKAVLQFFQLDWDSLLNKAITPIGPTNVSVAVGVYDLVSKYMSDPVGIWDALTDNARVYLYNPVETIYNAAMDGAVSYLHGNRKGDNQV